MARRFDGDMRQWNMRFRSLRPVLAFMLAAAVGVAMCPPGSASAPDPQASPAADSPSDRTSSTAALAAPRLRVKRIARGLDLPWDLTFLPSKAMLFTERDRERIWWRSKKGKRRVVARTPRGVWHSGETGLMAIETGPRFRKKRQFYTCHGYKRGGTQDVRVVLWKLNKRATKARQVRPIVRRLPSSSGRHGGCQLEFDRAGRLYIGTGDAAVGRNPQNLKSGGGKVLRVNPRTGKGVQANPFSKARNAMKRRVFTYGHRNVQGLSQRPKGTMWAVEHGSFRDDEVNRLRKRGNYGWNPVPGYNESVPMTDHGLPGKQVSARWKSGNPTIAPSGATWLKGRRWGAWRGALAVSVLANEHLRILRFNAKGKHIGGKIPRKLRNSYGRLRAAELGPGNVLYVTTSNGGGRDAILRIRPVS